MNDGWMDDGWIDDGWMDRYIYGSMVGSMDRLMDGWRGRYMD